MTSVWDNIEQRLLIDLVGPLLDGEWKRVEFVDEDGVRRYRPGAYERDDIPEARQALGLACIVITDYLDRLDQHFTGEAPILNKETFLYRLRRDIAAALDAPHAPTVTGVLRP